MLDLTCEVGPDLDAPTLGVLHPVQRAAHQQAVVETRDELFERGAARAEEGVRHACVSLALDGFPAAIGRAGNSQARGGVEVGDAALEDPVADDGRPVGPLSLVIHEVGTVSGRDGGVVVDVDELRPDALADVLRRTCPLLDEHVGLDAMPERLVRDRASGQRIGDHVVRPRGD